MYAAHASLGNVDNGGVSHSRAPAADLTIVQVWAMGQAITFDGKAVLAYHAETGRRVAPEVLDLDLSVGYRAR